MGVGDPRGERAPLRLLDTEAETRGRAHGVPSHLTSFLGRRSELRAVDHLLSSRSVVTLTGAGGCGKSRLAAQMAGSRVGNHPEGVWFCSLGPLQDPALVVHVVSDAVGVGQATGRPLVDLVAARLEPTRALLVLDGCEHVLPAVAELIEDLAGRCPEVRFLVTSREPLGLDGEATFHVPPLRLPKDDADTAAEAVALFVDRARLVQSNFHLTPTNRSAVIEVCRRVDGIPLAIELAAANCRILEPAEIAAELSRRFSILAGGPRRAVARHRTLEASIDWSYQLLSRDEQLLFQQLSAFSGDFDVEAAAAVAGYRDTAAMVTSLSGLVDKSLVERHSGESTRFRLLDAIRDYADRRLNAEGLSAEIRGRHLAYFTMLAERHDLVTLGSELADWIVVLDRNVDNFRAALDWSEGEGDCTLGYRLGVALAHYWSHRGVLEGHVRLHALLQKPCDSILARANLLHQVAAVSWLVGDMSSVGPALVEGLSLAAELSDDKLRGRLLLNVGWLRLATGDMTAPAMFRDASALSEAAGDEWYAVDALMGLAYLASMEGRAADSVDASSDALARARAMRNPLLVIRASFFHALCTARAGDLLGALGLFDAHMKACRSLGDHLLGPLAAVQVALTVGQSGDDERATSLLSDAKLWADREGSALALTVATLADAVLAYRRGDPAPPFDEAEAAGAAAGHGYNVAWCQAMRAMMALNRGDVGAARSACYDAERTLSAPFTGWARPWEVVVRSHIERVDGDPKRAADLAIEAIDLAEVAGGPCWLPEAIEALAAALAELAVPALAGRCLGAASALRAELGQPIAHPEKAAVEAAFATVLEALGDDAADQATSAGAEAPLAAVLTSLHRRRGERKRPQSGWASLTPTEVEVVELVCDGLRNAEIAERLFVAPSTVKTHLNHLFTKLDVTSRSQLAARANARRTAARPNT